MEDSCLIIMQLRNESEEIYSDIIKPSVEQKGLKCILIDQSSCKDMIIRNIVELIRNAKVVIADLTGRNPSIYYLLGLAHALNPNVIMLAHKDEYPLPFDLSVYDILYFESTYRGGKKLIIQMSRLIESMVMESDSYGDYDDTGKPSQTLHRVESFKEDILVTLPSKPPVNVIPIRKKKKISFHEVEQ